MNILYLINFAGKSGTEKYVLNLMHILSERGETCHLAYNVPGQLSETISAEGFPCFRFDMSAKNALSAAKKLAGYCRANAVDVIHAQYPMENVIAILSKRFYRSVKVVYTAHLTIYQNMKWKILNRIVTPFDHRVIAVCRQGADILAANGVKKDRIRVICNGIEPSGERVYDRSFAREFGVPDETFVMSIMARYSPEKGLPFLLASLAKLRRKTQKPFVCFIAGDKGEEFDNIAVMITNSGLGDCVIQLGFRRDTDRMLKSSDLYLNTSSSEAMSFAILEAMNAGVPLVVTDVGGNPDLAVKNTVCGEAVKFGDSDAFSDAMLELMENDALRSEYSANALKKVSEEFDLRKLASDVFEAYK